MNDPSTHPEETGDQARTRLAGERTFLAGERTLLAWIRTSVAMMGFGFLVARFGLFLHELAATRSTPSPPSVGWSAALGTALVLMGAAVNVYACVRHFQFVGDFGHERATMMRRSLFPILLSVSLAILGFAMAYYLVRIA